MEKEQTFDNIENNIDVDSDIEDRQMIYFLLVLLTGVVIAVVLYFAVNTYFKPKADTAPAADTSAVPVAMKQQQSLNQQAFQKIQTMDPQGGAATQWKKNPQSVIAGGQYICPHTGHTSLPRFNQQGQPICPECGSVMRVNSMADGTTPPR